MSIQTVVAFRRWICGISCILSLTLLFGCVEFIPKHISVSLNGDEVSVSDDSIKLEEGKLFATAELMEQLLDKDVEASIKSFSADTFYQDQVAVLMYHHIDPDPKEPGVLYLRAFENQMELLKNNGFNVITMDEYVRYMTEGAAVPDNAILITFDDGYESFYTYAYPVLRKYGYTATNFVIVSAIDQQSGIRKLTWDQMREMKQAGMSFYSHTYNSHRYGIVKETGKKQPVLVSRMFLDQNNRLETDVEYRQRVHKDLTSAEERLRTELGNTRGIVAFPYGASNATVLELLKGIGVELTFTIKPGLNTRDNKNAYRFNAGSDGAAPQDVIVSLKKLGEGDSSIVVKVNGDAVTFKKVKPYSADIGVMIPLRELCELYNVKMDWDSNKRAIKLMKVL